MKSVGTRIVFFGFGLAVVLLYAWGLVGCAPAGRNPASAPAVAPITDETPAELPDDPFAVLNSQQVGAGGAAHERAVVGLELLSRSGDVIDGCTGVLIRADVILTAGHCFDSSHSPGLQSVRVRATHDLNLQNEAPARTARVRFHVKHPLYNSKQKVRNGIVTPFYDHDVAIGFLERPLEIGWFPSVVEADEGLPIGTRLIAYGFGRAVDWNERHKREFKWLHTKQRGILVVSKDRLEERVYTEAASPSSLCNGDSGGPGFVMTKRGPMIATINSAAQGKVLMPGSTFRLCRGASVVQPLAPMRPWIDQVLRGNGR